VYVCTIIILAVCLTVVAASRPMPVVLPSIFLLVDWLVV